MAVATEAKIVVAWTGFAGPNGDVGHGERFPSDSPLVTQAPGNFVPADTPERDWPTAIDSAIELVAAREREVARVERERVLKLANANPVKLDVKLYRATRDFIGSIDGQPAKILKGSIVHGSSQVLLDYGDEFAQVKR